MIANETLRLIAIVLLVLLGLAAGPCDARNSGAAPGQESVTPQQFGAVCDNQTDDSAALQRAIDFAEKNRVKLRIPRCNYVLANQIRIDFPIDVETEASTNFRFTDAQACGIVIDFRARNARFGLNSMSFGGLYAPSVTSDFRFPGYPANWSAASRSGCDAVTVMGGSRMNISIQYILGFRAGVLFKSTYDADSGPSAPSNINLRINTADILTYGLRFDAGPKNAGSIVAIDAAVNTVFAKFPIYFSAKDNGISQVNARITGQAFTNETDGACVYGEGGNIRNSSIDILWCYAGYSPSDSPAGTDANLSLPYLAGDGSSNGLLRDGHAMSGYWTGQGNRISIGAASDLAALPGGFAANGGGTVRVRDAGENVVSIPHAGWAPAILLARQSGESRYAGGVGYAALTRGMQVRLDVPTLPPYGSTTFYAYNSLLSPARARFIDVKGAGADGAPVGLSISATDNSANVNREIVVVARNETPAEMPAQSLTAWLEIGP